MRFKIVKIALRYLALAILINSYQFWVGVLFYELSNQRPFGPSF